MLPRRSGLDTVNGATDAIHASGDDMLCVHSEREVKTPDIRGQVCVPPPRCLRGVAC